MPNNIPVGQLAEFNVCFLSSAGGQIVPAGGTLTITYPQGSTLLSTTLTLSALSDGFFQAFWDSSVSSVGPASYTVTPTGLAAPVATGQLNITD